MRTATARRHRSRDRGGDRARARSPMPRTSNRAVRAARAAFDEGPWKDATAQDRGRVLFKLAEIVRARAAELAELETRNTGKPIVEAEFDIADVATCFEYYGGLATKIHGDVIPVPDNAMSLALREPIGVAGQIIPWNYPLLMAAWKLAPAHLRRLHDGAEAGRADAAHGAGAGLELRRRRPSARRRQHRHRRRRDAGAAIVEHPDVDKIAFTGSAEVGKTIMRAAAGDAEEDLARARRQVAEHLLRRRRLRGRGRGRAVRRVLQPGRGLFGRQPDSGAAVDLQDASSTRWSRRRARLPSDRRWTATTKMGAARQPRAVRPRARVSGDRQARSQGWRSAAAALSGGDFDRGYFVEPTIFVRRRTTSARIAREEIFGPVAGVIPFDDEARGAANRERHLLRTGRRRLDARHLPGDARRQSAPRRHRLGESHAADLRRSAVGRLQAERHRPRAREVGRRRISAT